MAMAKKMSWKEIEERVKKYLDKDGKVRWESSYDSVRDRDFRDTIALQSYRGAHNFYQGSVEDKKRRAEENANAWLKDGKTHYLYTIFDSQKDREKFEKDFPDEVKKEKDRHSKEFFQSFVAFHGRAKDGEYKSWFTDPKQKKYRKEWERQQKEKEKKQSNKTSLRTAALGLGGNS